MRKISLLKFISHAEKAGFLYPMASLDVTIEQEHEERDMKLRMQRTYRVVRGCFT
jgi:hypothetical protein